MSVNYKPKILIAVHPLETAECVRLENPPVTWNGLMVSLVVGR